MAKNILQKGWIWSGGFILIFLLTQDYLFTKWESGIGLLGLSNWMFWFMGIHILFLIFLLYFSKKYWNKL